MITRRQLLASGAVLLSPSILASEDWDETVDIIVVGSGLAGLSAALTAREEGADVLLIEKMESLGGNSAICTGDMAVPGTEIQQKLGIQDSPELMYADLIRTGLNNDPKRCRTLVNEIKNCWKWTKDTWHVNWDDSNLQQDAGQTVPRGHMSKPRSGFTLISAALNYAEALKVKIRAKTWMEEIILGSDGEALGLKVRSNYQFPDENSGQIKKIRANRGVILCYGGFGADNKFLRTLFPLKNVSLQTTNQLGATAENLSTVRKAGVSLIHLDQIQLLSWLSSDEVGIGNAWGFIVYYTTRYGIWVNEQGKRFVDETSSNNKRADAMVAQMQQGERLYAIVSEAEGTLSKEIGSGNQNLEELVQRGIVRRYSTLSELAQRFSVNQENLIKTLRDFNSCAASHTMDHFGRLPQKRLLPSEGPWLVVEIQPKVHHCMGGIETDSEGRVVSVHGKVIKKLFAAGEATGGTFGKGRIPSHSLADALVFGRVCAKSAMSS